MKFRELFEAKKVDPLKFIINTLVSVSAEEIDSDYNDPDADQEYLVNDMIDKYLEYSSEDLEDSLDMEVNDLMDIVSDNRKKIVKAVKKSLER